MPTRRTERSGRFRPSVVRPVTMRSRRRSCRRRCARTGRSSRPARRRTPSASSAVRADRRRMDARAGCVVEREVDLGDGDLAHRDRAAGAGRARRRPSRRARARRRAAPAGGNRARWTPASATSSPSPTAWPSCASASHRSTPGNTGAAEKMAVEVRLVRRDELDAAAHARARATSRSTSGNRNRRAPVAVSAMSSALVATPRRPRRRRRLLPGSLGADSGSLCALMTDSVMSIDLSL